jgi:hypothetical protein
MNTAKQLVPGDQSGIKSKEILEQCKIVPVPESGPKKSIEAALIVVLSNCKTIVLLNQIMKSS